MGACDEACAVSLGETAPGADLGGSSKYSNTNFEDRSGGGLHVNKNWTWVRRSLKICSAYERSALLRGNGFKIIHLGCGYSLVT